MPQLPPFLLFLCLAAFCSSASAQQQDTVTHSTTVRTVKTTSREGKPFKSEQITAFVNGHQTKIEVLGLFKPAEIEMKSDRPAEQNPEHLTMRIQVKDKAHPVLTYFEQKAKLQYKREFYEHNIIPAMDAAKVSRVQYHQFKGTAYEGLLEDYLEVVLFGEEHVPHESLEFRTEPRKFSYFDVDGKILNQEEMPIMQKGTFITETLFGREAVECYGDPKFADGIIIIRTKK